MCICTIAHVKAWPHIATHTPISYTISIKQYILIYSTLFMNIIAHLLIFIHIILNLSMNK